MYFLTITFHFHGLVFSIRVKKEKTATPTQ